ncbi:hypothetical protein IM792_15460 [Mucilaginibacter sp. JRF]|uniref:hypothetical protein n=1 Tax=Mucilaginibacter sp. JRF TaxID=2780088 RepID=UPI001882DCAE|nr:hypothetical protein [Mucilaginibacter sp. JRF]MBE9585853.1 hypothetical protein [Mucilaginibacter sp. JRF]
MSLKRDIIFRIGVAIHHDFSDDFPELFTKDDFLVTNIRTYGKTTPTSNDNDIPWKDKYIDLLERYKDLIISSMNSHSIINQ